MMTVINCNDGRWLEKLLYCCNSCDGIWYHAMLPNRDLVLKLYLDRFIDVKRDDHEKVNSLESLAWYVILTAGSNFSCFKKLHHMFPYEIILL